MPKAVDANSCVSEEHRDTTIVEWPLLDCDSDFSCPTDPMGVHSSPLLKLLPEAPYAARRTYKEISTVQDANNVCQNMPRTRLHTTIASLQHKGCPSVLWPMDGRAPCDRQIQPTTRRYTILMGLIFRVSKLLKRISYTLTYLSNL
jgi:hypothetical protein